MRITLTPIVLILVTISSLYANEAHGQHVLERKFSLDIKNQSLSDVIGDIQIQTKVSFSYSKNAIKADELFFSLSEKKISIESFLKNILSNYGIDYEVVDNKVVLFKATHSISSNNGTLLSDVQVITGKVVNEEGQGIAGASVSIKGTSIAVSTNREGEFSLQTINSNSIFLFSYIGYASKEVSYHQLVNSKVVVLEKTITELENIVVTALGVRREERALGYSTQNVKGNTLKTTKGIDVATSLTGKVAGMIVKNSAEFAQAPELSLRGESPLIVIDGVPYGNMTLRDIPQDDIESIDFLKGATASALYGERGGAGAVMVTTIKGAANNGLEISFNSSSMLEAGYLAIPETQTTYGRVVNTSTNTYVRTGDGSWGPPLEGQDVIQWDPVSRTMISIPYIARGANNFENFLQNGHILNNNLSIANRGEFGGIRVSSTWVNNKGTYPNSRFDKITYSVGGDLNFNKTSIVTSLSYNKHNSPNLGFGGYTGYDPMYSMLIWGSPDWNILDYKDYWLMPNEQQNNSFTAGNNNPYFDRYERIRPYNKDVFNGQLTLNYDIIKGLKATIRTGYDTYSDKQIVRISQGSYQGGGNSKVMNRGGTEIWGETTKGSFSSGLSRGFSTNTEALLLGDATAGDFGFDGFIGTSIFYKEDEGIEAKTQGGLSVPGYYSLKASINPAAVNSVIWKKQTNSVFGKVGVNWRNLAFLEATMRNDWTSTLPEETRSYFYPSVSGSLILSDLLPKTNWLSFWKVRSNWTIAKGAPDIYDINTVYFIATNQWAGLPTATFPTSIRPSDVYSFASKSSEFGTQMSLFKNRISVDITYFKKRLYDLLRTAQISESSGYSSVYTNTEDQTERRGWELSFNVTPVKTEGLQWDIGLNWSKFANHYVKIDPKYAVQGRKWIAEGERVDHFVFNEHQTDNEGNWVMNNGVPTYKPILSLAGYADPDWSWGINTKLSYKSLSLGLSFDGRVGGLAQSFTEMYMWRSGNHPNSITEERYLDATNPGTKNYLADGVKVVSGAITYDANGDVLTDTRVFAKNDIQSTYKSYLEAIHKGTAWGGNPSPADLYSTTFFKLREAYLTYTFPQQMIDKLPFKGLSASLVGQNLIYWAKQFKYSDIDGGSENFTDPSLRYMGLNIKLDF
ncbi:SusC/RagA family TonB-linked outer membrane protein [Sphingobacterium bovistauri]|uniref:SusC/RagA family TonB-linked outer membrane protein n=1 Tax=Sphingobacterium bovistauri TaxID=2781959 RepID=A0ABS7Z0M4_9SPHI|nr:SusC/RagA family TonB-linked outer membrane protein [Sphingobacterium bovistauri]MCA5003718.1 SusC/RagA family TonB-linked outer membrane protein [Sphingobacterium bovistauri]